MVGIVILNYNNAMDTLNCIDSIIQFNTYPVKIVVVDNGSTKAEVVSDIDSGLKNRFDGDYSRVEEGADTSVLSLVTMFVSPTNDGYASGNNKGLELLYRDVDITEVMILNSDILFIEDIIGKLVEDVRTAPDAAIVSPILYKKDQQGIDYNCARKAIPLQDLFIAYMFLFKDFNGILSRKARRRNVLLTKDSDNNNPLLEIELPSGSCMLADKKLFKELGSFDPNTFLYNEENILWEKIKRIRKRNYLDARTKCIHLGATTIDNKATSMFILNCSIQSNHYYLTHYTDAGPLYLGCMKVFYTALRLKLILKKMFSK